MRLKNLEHMRGSRQNRTAATKEMEEMRLKKLQQNRQSCQKRKAAATPEEIEEMRRKELEGQRKYRQKRKAAATPEEMRLKRLEQNRKNYHKRRAAASPEEIEARKLKSFEKTQEEQFILKRALELLSENQELSLEKNYIVRKAEEIKAKRLKSKQYAKQYYQNRKATATPEEVEAMRLKNLEKSKRFRKNQTPEEREARRLKRLEQNRIYRQNKREKKKENSILRQAMELLRQNKEISSDEIEVLKLTKKINADRMEKNKLKERERAAMQDEFKSKTVAGWLSKDKVPPVLDEIKIEEEVLQESTIKAIPLKQNVDPILNEQLNSSCSWLLGSESFITEGNSQSNTKFPSFYGGSSIISESFAKRNGHSTKIDRRKSGLEESFRCMRVLIDATAKRDGLAVFGKQIAQKLRNGKKDVPELSIAKQLIDNILHNLTIGAYNSNTEIV